MIKNIYEESLNNLAYFQQTYSDYSSAIEYYNELEEINMRDKQYARLSRAYSSHATTLQLVGNYELSIDYSFKYEKLNNHLKSPSVPFLAKILISSNYIYMGEPKIGIDILQELQNDYSTIAKTGLDVGSGYYLSLIHI